jgi:hypothetical protein
MPIQGTFDVLSFTDVMQLVARKHLTGRLHVRSRSIGANLYFEEGLLMGADSGEPGHSGASDMRNRMEEICFDLLDAERGSFEFLPDTPFVGQYTLSLKVDTVLSRARRRLEEWRQIQAVIPSLELHPRILADLDRDEVTLSKDRWRLMTAIDGRRSIRVIARSLGSSDYDVCRTLKSLIDDGVVAVDSPPKSPTGPRRGRGRTVFVDDSADEAEADLAARLAATTNGGMAVENPPGDQVSEPAEPTVGHAVVVIDSSGRPPRTEAEETVAVPTDPDTATGEPSASTPVDEAPSDTGPPSAADAPTPIPIRAPVPAKSSRLGLGRIGRWARPARDS